MKDTIYLVDAYAQIYRGFFAIKGLSTSDGKPSNAIFAMARFLITLEKEFFPILGAFVFDLGAPVKRLEIAPEYKSQRPEMPEDLRCQIDSIRTLISAAGWDIIEKSGNEADDIIASIAKKFGDNPIRILSNDKDMAQIVDERVNMYASNPASKGFVLRDVQEIIKKFDVRPDQIIDYLSLVGDSSDNIPGIFGVGPKTAAKLLQKFGSINKMIERPEEIDNLVLKEKILNSESLLKKNKELITLDADIELVGYTEPNNFKKHSLNIEEIMKITTQYELKSIEKEFKQLREKIENPTLFDFVELENKIT